MATPFHFVAWHNYLPLVRLRSRGYSFFHKEGECPICVWRCQQDSAPVHHAVMRGSGRMVTRRVTEGVIRQMVYPRHHLRWPPSPSITHEIFNFVGPDCGGICTPHRRRFVHATHRGKLPRAIKISIKDINRNISGIFSQHQFGRGVRKS